MQIPTCSLIVICSVTESSCVGKVENGYYLRTLILFRNKVVYSDSRNQEQSDGKTIKRLSIFLLRYLIILSLKTKFS